MIFYWTSFYTYVNKLHSNSGVFISFIVLNNLKDTNGGITSKSCFRYLNSNPATLQSFQFGSDKILFLFNKMISSYISKTVDNASVFLILICANKTKNKRVPGVVLASNISFGPSGEIFLDYFCSFWYLTDISRSLNIEIQSFDGRR